MGGIAAQIRHDRARLGIVMMLVTYLFFSFIDTSAKWLVLMGISGVQIAFMRYVGHLAITLVQIGSGGWSWQRFATTHPGLVVLRAGLLITSTVINFFVLKYLSLTITSAILFSAPIIVCALSMPLLGERVGKWRWFAIFLGFAGVLIVVRPFGISVHWSALLAVINAISFSLYSILTRRLAGAVATQTMQFYVGAIGTLVLLLPAVLTWKTPAGLFDWGLLVGVGAWGWAGHELLTRAHAFAPASALMPYGYSFIIYMSIASYLVFDTIPDGWTLIGASIIVLSGLIIWRRENMHATEHASN